MLFRSGALLFRLFLWAHKEETNFFQVSERLHGKGQQTQLLGPQNFIGSRRNCIPRENAVHLISDRKNATPKIIFLCSEKFASENLGDASITQAKAIFELSFFQSFSSWTPFSQQTQHLRLPSKILGGACADAETSSERNPRKKQEVSPAPAGAAAHRRGKKTELRVTVPPLPCTRELPFPGLRQGCALATTVLTGSVFPILWRGPGARL